MGRAEASKRASKTMYLERVCYLVESTQPNGAKIAIIEGNNMLEILCHIISFNCALLALLD